MNNHTNVSIKRKSYKTYIHSSKEINGTLFIVDEIYDEKGLLERHLKRADKFNNQSEIPKCY